MPGQTSNGHDHQSPALDPSMEGRTIARPDVHAHSVSRSVLILQWRAGQLPGQTPARRGARTDHVPFNGGPDNCPARRRMCSPGRSVRRTFNGGPDNCPARHDRPRRPGRLHPPSMEGRTIARPDMYSIVIYGPAKIGLQWRAGQLPGQTSQRCRGCCAATSSFNGGPDNCPARPASAC